MFKLLKRILFFVKITFMFSLVTAFVIGGLPGFEGTVGMLRVDANNGFVSISGAPLANSMVPNRTVQLNASVFWLGRSDTNIAPNNANAQFQWFSSNPSVATVSSTGLVTARAAGTVIISAYSLLSPQATPARLTIQVIGMPTIQPRSRWTSDPHRMGLRTRTPQRVIFHHNAGAVFTNTTEAAAINYILGFGRVNGGSYHFAIDPAGRIWELIPRTHMGAHTYNYNNDIGIAFLGNYHPQTPYNPNGGQQLNAAQRTAAEQLTRWLVIYYNMNTIQEPPANQAIPRIHAPVAVHSDFTVRACPGDFATPWVMTLRQQINTWIRNAR